jgi:hypothetical protein
MKAFSLLYTPKFYDGRYMPGVPMTASIAYACVNPATPGSCYCLPPIGQALAA